MKPICDTELHGIFRLVLQLSNEMYICLMDGVLMGHYNTEIANLLEVDTP